MRDFKVVLSSVAAAQGCDGIYSIETMEPVNISGKAHYIGHPTTRKIVEDLGANYTPRLFSGLKIGGTAVCVALTPKAMKIAREGGYTADHPATRDDLQWRMVIRLG